MVHHECVIVEDGGIGGAGDSGDVPDYVLEHVMRTPHLHQVFCLSRGQLSPLSIIDEKYLYFMFYLTSDLTLCLQPLPRWR